MKKAVQNMELLSVKGLNKNYEGFSLKNVTFSLEQGYIMGFIGRNGAGKTTTLKSILGLVHTDGGSVSVFGKEIGPGDCDFRRDVAFALGGANFYPRKKIKVLTDVTRRFFDSWDEKVYEDCLKRFELDPEKRIDQLSSGMQVKYSLALALSHNARLIILDEPTSGLDPVSRDDLIELFQEVISGGERSILFSTHITSDLDKCADYITYIRDGEIIASTDKDGFTGGYCAISGTLESLSPELESRLIGAKKHSYGYNALIRTSDIPSGVDANISLVDLEDIMIHLERE